MVFYKSDKLRREFINHFCKNTPGPRGFLQKSMCNSPRVAAICRFFQNTPGRGSFWGVLAKFAGGFAGVLCSILGVMLF